MPLDVRAFTCGECGTTHDRDENAAKNILKFAGASSQSTAGQAGSNGRGASVRPRRASARSGGSRRSVNHPALKRS
jgi:putative transposase